MLLKEEPYTSVVDLLEEQCHEPFNMKKGGKIAVIDQFKPYWDVVLEMEEDGRVLMDECEGITIVIEKDKIVDLGRRTYNINDVQYDLEKAMWHSL